MYDHDEQYMKDLVALKKKKLGLKVLISVGGWDLGGEPFPIWSASQEHARHLLTPPFLFWVNMGLIVLISTRSIQLPAIEVIKYLLTFFTITLLIRCSFFLPDNRWQG